MENELRDLLNRPLRIGSKRIENRLFLAPMAKLGNIAMREIISSFGGCGLFFSEMVSSRSIPSAKGYELSGYRWNREELPSLVCQIYGNDPATMARAACDIEKQGFFGVDINFGCSAAAICKRNCGAALLRDPLLSEKIVSAVRKAASIPLFVKFRAGWKNYAVPYTDLARRFEDAGADAITFHPRIAPDRRTRPARWEFIARVREAVSIPLFGNGDVFEASDCLRMIRTTGCDGVSLGRIAAAKPWVFSEWTESITASEDIYRDCPLMLSELLPCYFKEKSALRRFRLFSSYYATNFRFGHCLHTLMLRAQSMEAVKDSLTSFFETRPAILSHPKTALFN